MPGRQVIRRPHKMALSLYRRLPRFLRLFIVRRIAPGHTVGALCLIEHQGRLLMLNQHHRRGWTFPGGLLNRGEDAAEAVVREVEEETGLRIQVHLPFTIVVDPSSRRVDILYWVQADSAPSVRASGEAVTAEWVAPANMGEVDDPTAEALAQFARFRAGASHQGQLLYP
ncbi:MAG TPA: NUDIX domain-containing protein [Kineosporiaceae bacterium]|nr:NUDIX domain-containing protein [Kineosporiaceae bacterium]